MNFLKRLSNFINKKDNNSTAEDSKNNTKSINGAKIENSDNKKKNEKIRIETMKSEFDKLASQINNFFTLFNESKNNANVKLLEIIENLYAIHNNLITKIKYFGIEIEKEKKICLWKKDIKRMKQEYECTIFCDDSNLTELTKKDIQNTCEINETLRTILDNFERLKSIIAELNVQQLKSINIEFESFFDKDKNKEIENMREKILASLGNLCKITYEELIEFFVNIFLAKQAIQLKKIEEQKKKLEEEKRKRLEEEERRKKEEEEKKFKELEKKEKTKTQKELSELMDKFLEKYPSDFDYKDATDDFYSIFEGIMKMCRYSENTLNFYKWNVEFDDNGELSEKSANELKNLCQSISNKYSIEKKITFLYEGLKNSIEKFFDKDGKNFERLKEYFKNCHLNPKTEKQKLQQEEEKQNEKKQNEALQEVKKLLLKNGIPKENIQKYQNECKNIKTEFESNKEISETLKKYYYIYLNLYNFLSRVDSKVVGKKLNVDLNNDELNYKLECLNKLKEWFKMILGKINSKGKSLKDIKKLFKGSFFKKSSLKILFEDLSNKNFSIEKIQTKELEKNSEYIDKLKKDFLKNGGEENIKNFQSKYQIFTVQKIIDFFNEYYKYYSDLYDIYECLPTKKNKELDAKIEYTNISADLTSDEYKIPLIKKTIKDISNNIPKFEKIQEWFKKITKTESNNYRGNIEKIFYDSVTKNEELKKEKAKVKNFLNVLRYQKLPTKEDVEIIKKQQFPSIENWN